MLASSNTLVQFCLSVTIFVYAYSQGQFSPLGLGNKLETCTTDCPDSFNGYVAWVIQGACGIEVEVQKQGAVTTMNIALVAFVLFYVLVLLSHFFNSFVYSYHSLRSAVFRCHPSLAIPYTRLNTHIHIHTHTHTHTHTHLHKCIYIYIHAYGTKIDNYGHALGWTKLSLWTIVKVSYWIRCKAHGMYAAGYGHTCNSCPGNNHLLSSSPSHYTLSLSCCYSILYLKYMLSFRFPLLFYFAFPSLSSSTRLSPLSFPFSFPSGARTHNFVH